MGLLSSLFSRSRPATGGSADTDSGDTLTQARTRARQRLMGAVVLVGIGIIGFPLLFETQPRPIAVDVPIEIPRKETAAPLALPTARAPAAKAPAAPPAEPTRDSAGNTRSGGERPESEVITETAAEAGLGAASRPTASASAVKPDGKADARAEAKPAPSAEPKSATAAAAATAPAPGTDAARAQALLEGRVPASAPTASSRFIVQIGAFADPALAQQTRLKVERLGLVTYTHVAQTADGARTRVRVGPVATRQEADKMAARIKAAGMPAAILTL